jgi:hypothetical protein
MNVIPAFKPAYFVALFVDASTGVPRSLSSPPTLVGKTLSTWGLVDWFGGTMVAVSGATGAYAYYTGGSYVTYGDQGYMAWPQWSDQNVRLAYFGNPVYALAELSYLDATVSSRLQESSYVAAPTAADVQAAVWNKALPAPGTFNTGAGLAALTDALLSWTASSGEASGALAVASHSCQNSGGSLSANSAPMATRCGGYCYMSAYLYFTQSAPLSGVTAATLTIYSDTSGTGHVSVEMSANPADPTIAPAMDGRTFSDPIQVSLIAGDNQVDITDLLEELADTAPGGTRVGIQIGVGDYYTNLNFTTFGEEHQASLTVQQTVPVPSLQPVADAVLLHDWEQITGTIPDRSTLNALRFLRNKWAASGGMLTVYEEDDETIAWTSLLTTNAGAAAITGVTPEVEEDGDGGIPT